MDTVVDIINDACSRRYPSSLIQERAIALLDRLEDDFTNAKDEASSALAEDALLTAIIALDWLFTS